MRIQRFIAATLAAALLLSGCASLSLSGNDILAPPKAAGHRAAIQSLIEEDSGGYYSLLYPTSGSYKSGIILHDTDGDGSDEAVALYTAADGTPRLLTAVQQDENYRLDGSIALDSANISSLNFADVNADGTQELLISFDAGSPLASLKAYFLNDGINELSVAESFNDFITGDFDGNSADDILLLYPTDGQAPAKASLTVYAEGAFSEKASCEIDSDVISYAQLRYGKINGDIDGAIADGMLLNGDYTTQLLYYDSAAHMLLNPLFQNNSYGESVRSVATLSTDIDDDGIAEIPLCFLPEHAEGEDESTVCSIARWSGYDPEQMALIIKQDAILCEKLGFMLCLNTEQLNEMTARYTADNAVTLYRLNFTNAEAALGAELLTIKRYEKNSYDSSLTAEADLFESTTYIYTYILGEGSPFTHNDIENSFTLLGADEYSKR